MEARHPNRVDMGLGRSPSFKQVNEALNEFKSTKPNLDNQIETYYTTLATNMKPHIDSCLSKATPEIDTSPQMFILGMSERSAISCSKRATIRHCIYGTISNQD